jgi:hypothetical protein
MSHRQPGEFFKVWLARARVGRSHRDLVGIDTTEANAHQRGVPAYLETSTEANVAWYRHHGFEVQHEVRPVAGGPPVWTMWREPRS